MHEERPARGRLDSWKEIAAYLNRDVRTVIRWEREKALPVHRVPGGKRQAVFAFPAEIDAWLAGCHANGNHANPNQSDPDHTDDDGSKGGRSKSYASASLASAKNGSAEPEDHLEAIPVAAHLPKVESHPARTRVLRLSKWKIAVAAALLFGLVWIAGAVFVDSRSSAAIRPFRINRLTDDGRGKTNLHTDGTRLYFNEVEGARFVLASAPVSGTPIHFIDTGFSNAALQDLSKDGKTLLFSTYEGIVPEGPLWTIPTHGGAPHRMGDVVCNAARWSPDNRRIACATGTSLIVMNADGSNARTIASFSSPVGQIVWNPDGRHLRYILTDTTAHTFSQWELEVDGSQRTAHNLDLGPDCCYDWNWTHDGKAFMYTEVDASGKLRLMMQRRRSAAAEFPVNIGGLWSAVPDSTGKSLYLLISDSYRGELLKFDTRQKALETFLPGISGAYVAFSPDRQWITYAKTQDNSFWRSRVDGSDALELAGPPAQVEVSSWSPDGHTIAFMKQTPGGPWRIFLIGRDGGPAREASEGSDNQGGPSWSPDGKSIVYGNVDCDKAQSCWIRSIDVATGKTQILPGSKGLRTARWSPDGKHIAALRFRTRDLMLFDIDRQRWKVLADSVSGDNINWSSDSRYIYVDSPRDKKPVVERVRVSDGHRNTVVSLLALQKVPGQMGSWIGLTPDNSPILSHLFTTCEIYKLDWTDR